MIDPSCHDEMASQDDLLPGTPPYVVRCLFARSGDRGREAVWECDRSRLEDLGSWEMRLGPLYTPLRVRVQTQTESLGLVKLPRLYEGICPLSIKSRRDHPDKLRWCVPGQFANSCLSASCLSAPPPTGSQTSNLESRIANVQHALRLTTASPRGCGGPSYALLFLEAKATRKPESRPEPATGKQERRSRQGPTTQRQVSRSVAPPHQTLDTSRDWQGFRTARELTTGQPVVPPTAFYSRRSGQLARSQTQKSDSKVRAPASVRMDRVGRRPYPPDGVERQS